VGIVVLLLILLMLSGCRSIQYVPVIEHRTDSLYITKYVRDSIYLQDSTSVKDMGDTVTIEKWHTKYIARFVHDTVYIATHDTVPSPYPVEVKVPAELSWWHRVQMVLGDVLMIGLLTGGALLLIKWRL
jgi:hypothetical protein